MMDDVFFSCARFSMSLLAGVKAKLRDEAVSVEVVTGGEKGVEGGRGGRLIVSAILYLPALLTFGFVENHTSVSRTF